MSASFTGKTKTSMKDKTSSTKLVRTNFNINNDMQALKTSLMEVLNNNYQPKMKTIYLTESGQSKSKLPKDEERSHCPVITVTLDSYHRHVVRAISWKNFLLRGETLETFICFCDKYSTLNSLRLEDCQLEEDDITILAKFIDANPNITDLNLNGNPYQQNFNALLTINKLRYLTLKFCGITDDDLSLLIEPAMYPYQNPLLYLNLSNNRVSDNGAMKLSDLLRINRSIISLNLCSNKITNEGAKKILEALMVFHLNQEEISKRRKIYYNYYLAKYDQITSLASIFVSDEAKTLGCNSSTSSTDKKGKKQAKTKNRTRKSANCRSVTSLDHDSPKASRGKVTSAPPSKLQVPPIAKLSDLPMLLDFQSAYHPFVKETTLSGFEFICRGNFVLMHLNLSFNLLTDDILSAIHSMLSYQNMNGSNEEGLKGISFHGNKITPEGLDRIQQELLDLLALKSSRNVLPSLTSMSKEAMPRKERKSSKHK